jgi:FMN phosphatase YigB (HAD superfamily)
MTEIEKENTPFLLREVFAKRGIKYGFFDLDGTMIDTTAHYGNYMYSFAEAVSSLAQGGKEAEWVFKSMEKTLRGLRPQFSVHPALMQETARVTALRFGVDFYSEGFQMHVGELMSLYEKAPKAFDGVHEALNVFKQGNLGLVVATHSDDSWTRVRLAKNGLLSYFDGHVFSFDSRGEKGIPEWESVYADLGVTPKEVVVSGDSIQSDIFPNLILGVPPEQVFKVATGFRLENKGMLPEGVVEIESFADLPYAILDKLS